jgi:glyoxylase-like metal-dependent hydrolase (beta-lactamase superfamily II)
LHTPGHAEHHDAYVFQDTCFSGNVGGVRKAGLFYAGMPFAPPETHLGKWRDSLERIRQTGCFRLALTHFGIYEDSAVHLTFASRVLDEVEQWMETVMCDIPDSETLYGCYMAWLHERGHALGLDESILKAYDFASPTQMGPVVYSVTSTSFGWLNKVILLRKLFASMHLTRRLAGLILRNRRR